MSLIKSFDVSRVATLSKLYLTNTHHAKFEIDKTILICINW